MVLSSHPDPLHLVGKTVRRTLTIGVMYHNMDDLLFDLFRFDQTSKTVLIPCTQIFWPVKQFVHTETTRIRAVALAELAERPIPTPEVRCSNLVISQLNFTHTCVFKWANPGLFFVYFHLFHKTQLKFIKVQMLPSKRQKKRLGMAHLKSHVDNCLVIP